MEVTENPVVCDSCQKSLASFSTLIASWSIANGWNDEDMKEEFDEFEMVQVKKENFDEFSDSNTNSSTGIIGNSDSATKTTTTKKGKSNKNGQAATRVKVKTESGDVTLSDSSESVSVKHPKIKKEEQDQGRDDEDAEMKDLQLHNEEVD